MRSFISLSLCAFFLGFSVLVSAQVFDRYVIPGHYFLNYSLESSTWDMETDSNGMVFMAGRQGIYRFNGSKVDLLPMHESLQAANFMELHVDANSGIWAKSYTGKIARVTGDSVLPYKWQDSITHLSTLRMDGLHMTTDGTLYLSVRGRGLFSVSPQGRVTEEYGRPTPNQGYGFKRCKDGHLMPFYVLRSVEERGDSLNIFLVDDSNRLDTLLRIGLRKPFFETTLLHNRDDSYTFSLGNAFMLRFRNDTVLDQKLWDLNIIKLFEDSRGDLWMGTYSDGVQMVRWDDWSEPVHLLDDLTAAVVAEDFSGGLLFKSNNFDFGYLPAMNIPRLAEDASGKPIAEPWNTTSYQDEFWMNIVEKKSDESGHYGGSFFYQNNDTSYQFAVPEIYHGGKSKKDSPRTTFLHYDSLYHRLWAGFALGPGKFEDGAWHTYNLKDEGIDMVLTMRGATDSNGVFYGLSSTWLYTIEDDSVELIQGSGEYISRFTDLEIDRSGRIWIGALEGLYELTSTGMQMVGNAKQYSDHDGIKLLEVYNDLIWVQSAGNEIGYLSNDSIIWLVDDSGLPIKVSAMTVAPDGRLWLLRLNIPAVTSIELRGGEVILQDYGWDNHFKKDAPHNEQGLVVTSSMIIQSTLKGIFQFPIADLKPLDIQMKPFITKVKVNLERVAMRSFYDLQYDENSLFIEFENLNFSRVGEQIRYRMSGSDDAWVRTEYKTIQYTNLPPGEYVFQVQSRVESGAWIEGEPITFFIATPFWMTWWFWGICILVFGGSIWRLTAWYYGVKQQQTMLQLQQVQSEQKALRAQVNPHFIFNVISSVQYLVTFDSGKKASDYLGLFARLIRNVLESSFLSLVQLQSEMEQIETYLKLEQMGLEKPFSYRIDLSGAEAETLIPPSLIQIYVENAVKHGLTPLGDKGLIEITAKGGNALGIEILITDNGVGRQHANKEKRPVPSYKKSSRGMMLSDQRIELLNNEVGKEANVTVVDLKEENGDIKGTQVRLWLKLQAA